ncbi:MAG: septum formation protein [Sphingobacteriales bacterium]|jgi:septum formation protein
MFEKKIVLASKSPRRVELIKDLGFDFRVVYTDVDEVYPPNMSPFKIPGFLARLKSKAVKEIADDEILLTADTMVYLGSEVLGKPADEKEARKTLKALSGNMHTVITGVCLKTKKKTKTFSVRTKVYFNNLTDDEINYYIKNGNPFDKAGSYGIQEWIGFVAVNKIVGSYTNIVGLPMERVWAEVGKF